MRIFGTCLILIALTGVAGCSTMPNFGSPGTIGTQRNRAVLHDPFPSSVLGPEIVGGRPKGFDLPMSEAADIQGSPFATQGGQYTPPTGF